MPNDIPLSVEELQRQLAETQAKLETISTDSTEEQEEAPQEEPTEETPIVEESQEQEDDESEDEQQEEEEIIVVQEDNDVTERYKESSKEARSLLEDRKKIDSAFHEAHNLSEPTEADLKQEYPEWDLMSDTEKRLAKDNVSNKRRFAILENAAEERRVVDQWNDKVDIYIENPKTFISNPLLEGKGEQFKAYAKSKEYRNINFDVLVSSFLYKVQQEKVTHKGKMFETGQGGDKTKIVPKDDKLSIEEGARLMKTDYNKYKEYLLKGKIANE